MLPKEYEVKGKNCPSCYIDVNGTNVCNYNSKLERIPKNILSLDLCIYIHTHHIYLNIIRRIKYV